MTATTASRIEHQAQKRILDIIVTQDDVSWKQIIFDLIENEQMDPWDINLSLISQRFIEQLKKLKEMDFRIGGKVVLASAILLKMKADRLQQEELAALDSLIHSMDEPVDMGLDMEMAYDDQGMPVERPRLIPRTPQPRTRKVSVYDLVQALEQALETEVNRPPRIIPRVLDTIAPPDHHIDISKVIQEVYGKIHTHYGKKKGKPGSLQFHHFGAEGKKDKVLTFIPLLHLENARKIDMEQSEHFGPITIHLLDNTPPDLTAFKSVKA